MPTVIDSLIVELGLDPAKFTSGQKAAIKSFSDAKDAAVKTASSIEQSSKRSAEFLGVLNNKLLQLGELIIGGKLTKDILNFSVNISKQDAATGKLAYTLETTSGKLDKWRNAAYLAGGSSEGITGFIQGLTSEFQKFAITGESSLIPFFRGLGVQISDEKTGKMRDFADIIRDVSNAVAKLGPAQGAEWLRSIGADQGTINLLIKGGDELERYLKLGSQFSTVNSQNTENATKLTLALNGLELALTGVGRSLLNYFSSPLISLAESHTVSLNEIANGQFISKGSLLDSVINGTKFRGFGPRKLDDVSGSSGAFGSPNEKEAFIRSEAAKRGINPDIAVAVSKSEGFKDYVGDQGTSFGAFQLHYKNNIPGLSNGGLGDTFTKKTGLDARDPATERQQIQFALDEASKSGWGAWHGWKGTPFAGIQSGGGGSNSSVKIDNVNISTQATDAPGIAATIKPAIERSSLAYQGQAGPQ